VDISTLTAVPPWWQSVLRLCAWVSGCVILTESIDIYYEMKCSALKGWNKELHGLHRVSGWGT